VFYYTNPYEAASKAHAVAVLTEWNEFIDYNWQQIFDNMLKPAFLFDGRNILNPSVLKSIGFKMKSIGK
jgi:UDPglucose 6-dehydrogenase